MISCGQFNPSSHWLDWVLQIPRGGLCGNASRVLALFVCTSRAQLRVLGETLSASWHRQLKLFASKRRPARWEKLKQEEAATWQRSQGECRGRPTECVQGGKLLLLLWLLSILPCLCFLSFATHFSRLSQERCCVEKFVTKCVTQKCRCLGSFFWLKLSCVRKFKSLLFTSLSGRWMIMTYIFWWSLTRFRSTVTWWSTVRQAVTFEMFSIVTRLNCPWRQQQESEGNTEIKCRCHSCKLTSYFCLACLYWSSNFSASSWRSHSHSSLAFSLGCFGGGRRGVFHNFTLQEKQQHDRRWLLKKKLEVTKVFTFFIVL